MKNLTKGFSFGVLFLLVIALRNPITAQCTKPIAETCAESPVFCSLNELNGAHCTNTSTIPSQCSPLCSQGGVPEATSWWGFVSQGGQVSITLLVGTCSLNMGLQWGIWGDCVCGQEILCRTAPCITPNTSSIATVSLKACKTYYLWIDGCNADHCDFTINTSGGAAPSLTPLGFINNISSGIIQPICEGACDVRFFVDPQPGGCTPEYVWTWDGDLAGSSEEIHIDIPIAGDFVLCVTAYIGNPSSGSICAQSGPKCSTVKVRKINDKIGVPRTICWEAANNGGYKWHSKKIYTSGTYNEQFSDANCCHFDSIVQFTVLDAPEKPDVYFITCNDAPYIDGLGRAHNPCKNRSEIIFTKSTNPFKCDSSIRLTAVNVNFDAKWKVQCYGGLIELSPNISVNKYCNVGESYQFEYKWYKKSAPKFTLSNDERYLVDALSEDYCVDVSLKTELGTQSLLCTKTFCETFNETDLLPYGIPITGDKLLCIHGTGAYRIDTLISNKILNYYWTIDGGTILTKNDSSAINVKWNLPQSDTGKVCLVINTDCGKSIERCIKVTFGKESAGKDYKQKNLFGQFNSPSKESGFWNLISGPGTTVIENPTNPKSKVRVNNYGLYCFEWTSNNINCPITDTVCIEFYKVIYRPTYIFDPRNSNSSEEESNALELVTPNLISTNGTSVVTINEELNVPIHYIWYNNLGRIIINEKMNVEVGMSQFSIHSPIHEGFYFLAIEINGATTVRKICVIE